MSYAFVGNRGEAFSVTSGTTIPATIATATVPVGALLIARGAFDNLATVTGDSTDVSVADTKGNTWTRLKEHQYSPGGVAGDGVGAYVFVTKVTTELVVATDSVTVTFGSAVVAKTLRLREFSGTAALVAGAAANTGTGTAPSATVGSLASKEHLWLGVTAVENNTHTGYVEDADYTNDAADTPADTGTPATSVASRGSRRIVTGTGDTFAPTIASADFVVLLVALEETADIAPTLRTVRAGLRW